MIAAKYTGEVPKPQQKTRPGEPERVPRRALRFSQAPYRGVHETGSRPPVCRPSRATDAEYILPCDIGNGAICLSGRRLKIPPKKLVGLNLVSLSEASVYDAVAAQSQKRYWLRNRLHGIAPRVEESRAYNRYDI